MGHQYHVSMVSIFQHARIVGDVDQLQLKLIISENSLGNQ